MVEWCGIRWAKACQRPPLRLWQGLCGWILNGVVVSELVLLRLDTLQVLLFSFKQLIELAFACLGMGGKLHCREGAYITPQFCCLPIQPSTILDMLSVGI